MPLVPYSEKTATEKPLKGEALIGSRDRRATRTAKEQKVMQAVLKRDGRQCRVPKCEHRSKQLPIDPCHMRHRGMGGDPKGTRTTLETLVALCRAHHGEYDADLLTIKCVRPAFGTNSTLDFYDRHGVYLGGSEPKQ